MLPALSWLAPATAPQADANMPAPRTAKIVSARLQSRSQSRALSETSRNRVIETKTRSRLLYNTQFLFFIKIKMSMSSENTYRGKLRR
jgi:hypothetical protein